MKVTAFTILLPVILLACSKNRIGPEEYVDLHGLYMTMESIAKDKSGSIDRNLGRLQTNFESLGWDQEGSEEYRLVMESHQKMMDFKSFISSWKDQLIEGSGGYNENGYLLNWNMKLPIMDYKPDNFLEEQNIDIYKGERSLIIELIELTNTQIKYLQDFHVSLNTTLSKYDYITESDLFLAESVKSNRYEFEEPTLWNFQRYPAKSFILDNQEFKAIDGKINFSLPEWQILNQELLNIKVPIYRGDTTFTFYLNSRN